MLIIIYTLIVLLLFWAYCGYMISLYVLIMIGKKPVTTQELTAYPFLSILVPCYNEADLVNQKIKNFKKIDYPKDKFEIFFLDGQSDDDTVKNLKKALKNFPQAQVIQTNVKGKINQINVGIKKAAGDIIVNTDMDSLLEPDCLIEMMKVFAIGKDVTVVGAHVMPKNAMPIDEKYWREQNKLRCIESKVYVSSIVIAPCYAYRKDFIKKFPSDCVADDIYISFYANTKGTRTLYAEEAVAYETRNPKEVLDYLGHKFRKGNAYILELLRFVYQLPVMPTRWKLIFFTKIIQVIIIPWLIPFFFLCAAALSLSGINHLLYVLGTFGFLFVSMLITRFLIMKNKERKDIKMYFGKGVPFIFFALTNAVLLLNGLSFPFIKQSSKYLKVGSQTKNSQ